MTGIKSPTPRTDLHGLHEHIDAMAAAESLYDRLAVLASALEAKLGGQRLACNRHPHAADLTFVDAVRHCNKGPHELGDLRPADPDPRQKRFGGDDL